MMNLKSQLPFLIVLFYFCFIFVLFLFFLIQNQVWQVSVVFLNQAANLSGFEQLQFIYMHSDCPKWSQATSFVTQMKFRQVKRQKNCDKLSYDVSHKASSGTLCLLCYGIFPYSFSYVSLANAFGAVQLTQLLSSKLIQTAVIFKSFFKTEKPILRCHQYLFAPQAV